MSRKDEHLEICLKDEVEQKGVTTGLENFSFEFDALPEVDFDEVSTEADYLGFKLEAPLMIGAMTGGTDKAGEYNRKMARAAEELGIAFSLGSQRPMLESDSYESYDVKKNFPNIRVLMGNLGAVQLNYGVGADEIRQLIEKVNCDGFTFHLNALQEAIQPEGDRNFKGLVDKLRKVIPKLGVPVSIKEVGCGISETTALKIRTLPVDSIEVAGVGGTSWAYIEAKRNDDPVARTTGIRLKDFGIPTSESIQICRRIFPERYIVGSGGIRSGLHIAKCLALGADIVAFALPVLKAADASDESVILSIKQIIHELKTVMFVTGSKRVKDLRGKLRFQKG